MVARKATKVQGSSLATWLIGPAVATAILLGLVLGALNRPAGMLDLSDEYATLLKSSVLVDIDKGDGRRHGGSGTFIAPGIVLTAQHVIAGEPADKIFIRNAEGKKEKGVVLWQSDKLDAAIIKTDLEGTPAKISCDSLKAGQPIALLGSPLVTEFVLAHGWVGSAKHGLAAVKGDGQMDIYMVASIVAAPGDSGGGVFNADGELVGFLDAVLTEPTMLGPVPADGLSLIIPASEFCRGLVISA